jgi:hypothetical protein
VSIASAANDYAVPRSHDTAMNDGSRNAAMDDGRAMGAGATGANDAFGTDDCGRFRRAQGEEACEEADTDESVLHGSVLGVEVELGGTTS